MAPGETGPAGPPGKDGANGKDGTNGTNGTNGRDGRDAEIDYNKLDDHIDNRVRLQIKTNQGTSPDNAPPTTTSRFPKAHEAAVYISGGRYQPPGNSLMYKE